MASMIDGLTLWQASAKVTFPRRHAKLESSHTRLTASIVHTIVKSSNVSHRIHSSDALSDLETLRKYDQQRVVRELQEQTSHEPAIETRRRKRLRPNRLAEWELRVGTFRVFYDVESDASVVRVVAIAVKTGSRLFVHGEEFEL
jgi:mRNA-degrading endonuclease RelE of RelBE toxin-antitoxin system